jgi:hypothetical protein
MEPTADDTPRDKSSQSNTVKEMVATETEQLHDLLKNYPGATLLEKVAALLNKVNVLEARQSHVHQQAQITAKRPDINAALRPKYTPRWSTWCQTEMAAKAQPDMYDPCGRAKCPFYHEDQHEYQQSGRYARDRDAGLVGDWGDLKPYIDRAGHNQRREKAGKKERHVENILKQMRKKKTATEAQANKEQAAKKRKAAIEAKATTDVALKKRKAGAAPSPKAKADKAAKNNEDDQTES